MGRIDAEPEAHRRVLNAVERLLGGAQAFAEWQLARQDGGVQQLLQQSREVRLGSAEPGGDLRRPFGPTSDRLQRRYSVQSHDTLVAQNPLRLLFHVRGEVKIE